ncbi:hypothetical protein HGM15179_013053, partial [Zosterops borbonicus]
VSNSTEFCCRKELDINKCPRILFLYHAKSLGLYENGGVILSFFVHQQKLVKYNIAEDVVSLEN